MFGGTWGEMLVIGVVALIVIGPKDLPVVMARLGKAVATIRRLGGEFQREINKTAGLDQLTDIRRSITEPLKSAASEITREFNRTLPNGEVVPSGAVTPTDPTKESVVDAIHAGAGVTPPPALPPVAHIESPAPIEAIAPVAVAAPKPARKPRAKATPSAAAPKAAAAASTSPAAKSAKAAPAKAASAKPATPRKPRAPKPKAEG